MPSTPQISSRLIGPTSHGPAPARRRPPGSLMIVSVTTQRMPLPSTGSAKSASAVVDHERAGDVAVDRATPTTEDSWPSSAEHAVGRSLQRAPADDGRDGDDRRPAGRRSALAHAGHGEHRPDRHDRVRRGDHHHLGAGSSASSTPGAGPGGVDAGERAPRDTATACWRPTKYSWKPISTPSSATSTMVAHAGRRSSAAGARPRPHAAAISAVTVVSVAPSARRCGAVQVRGQVAVAEVEPRRRRPTTSPAARRCSAPGPPWPATSRRPGPSRARGRWRRRACR